tara:strand:- start:1174 stop:1527 length:354 start_codon:yes stop_codon:yes gene_type:complete
MKYKFGSGGTLSLHYKGILCSTFPLTKQKTLQYYIDESNKLILKNFKRNWDIKEQILLCTAYCETIVSKRHFKQKITTQDNDSFLKSLFILLKTKQIENNNDFGYFIMPYKKYIKKC